MATSIIKTDELRLLNDQVVMSDGALTSNVSFPAGHVIDCKHAVMNSEISSISMDTWLPTGLSIDITPKYDNSKIVVWCTFGIAANDLEHNAFKVVRTGAAISNLHIHSTYINTGYVPSLGSYTATDFPNTDSVQCSYELYHYCDNNSAGYFFNYDALFASHASMILMEIRQ